MLPDLSIRQFEYLVAVDEHETWAEAAAAVGVSPSALSQGLAELERRVGVELFERAGRRRVLRADARPVVDHARQVLALTGDLVRWADRVDRGVTGSVRLGMIDASAVMYHSTVLRQFRRDRPDVELHLTVAPSSELLEQLLAGRLDAAVCVEPPAFVPGLELTPLMTEQLSVYGPPGRSGDDPESWGPWVLFPRGSHTRAVVEAALVDRGADTAVAAESHQPDVLKEMVGMGLGWTVLPRAQAEHGERPLADGIPLAERHLVLVTRTAAISHAALDALTDRLTHLEP